MDDQITQVMNLAGVTRHEAMFALKEHKTVINAVTSLMVVPTQIGAPKQKTMDDTQILFKEIRRVATSINDSVQKGFTSSGQSGSSAQGDLPFLPEETVQQSNCSPKCHPSAPELEVQIPETACQKPSGCSSGSQ